MIRVELARTFPVSLVEAFAYITDTKNRKEFFPNFVRLDDAARAKWEIAVSRRRRQKVLPGNCNRRTPP